MGAEFVQAWAHLLDYEDAFFRGQAPGTGEVERDQYAGRGTDMPAVFEREEYIRQNSLVDDTIDVPEGDLRDDGGFRGPQEGEGGRHDRI